MRYYRLITSEKVLYLMLENWKLTLSEEANSVIVAQEAIDMDLMDKSMKHHSEVVEISVEEYDSNTEFSRLEDEGFQSELHSVLDYLESETCKIKKDWIKIKEKVKKLNQLIHGHEKDI